jgi:hypothetical protein
VKPTRIKKGDPAMPGTTYSVQPIPPDPSHTLYVDAGTILIGVEHRLLDEAELAANYEGEAMQEIEAAVAGQDIQDNGVSLHIVGRDDDHEYLRFDMFEHEPHYHYILKSGDKQTIHEFDRIAHGEMLPWVLNQLRTRLTEMLLHAGGGDLLGKLDSAKFEASLVEVERLSLEAEAVLAAAK